MYWASYVATWADLMRNHQCLGFRGIVPKMVFQVLRIIWVCLKIVYPYTQWLMIIIPIKWL